jgi:hypothetical protein
MALKTRIAAGAARAQENPGKTIIAILLAIAFLALVGRAF